MRVNSLCTREIQLSDIPLLINYWLGADESHLRMMGVEPSRLPSAELFSANLKAQIESQYADKKSYCIIWELDGEPVGHSNLNPVEYGKEAYMHLHMWKKGERQRGLGFEFMKLTLPYFFEKMKLEILYCQPYALNPSPNRVLEKLGFSFVKEYTVMPGSINFEQEVKLWRLKISDFKFKID